MLPDIENECRLEWHEDPYVYRYLREAWVMSRSRTQPVPPGAFGEGERVIGYAVLRKAAAPSSRTPWGAAYWHRRVWWLYLDDAGMPQDNGIYGPTTESYPSEAVSPFSVRTARPSVFLHRRPSPEELEREDPRLRRLLAWLARRGGKAALREVLQAGAGGVRTSREALALAGRLAELGWCRIKEEAIGRTKQRTMTVEVIALLGERGF